MFSIFVSLLFTYEKVEKKKKRRKIEKLIENLICCEDVSNSGRSGIKESCGYTKIIAFFSLCLFAVLIRLSFHAAGVLDWLRDIFESSI